jgi:hypothetical protein
VIVLTMSIVTVMGPTPPGTGVMKEAFFPDPLKIDIADEFSTRQAIDPDI